MALGYADQHTQWLGGTVVARLEEFGTDGTCERRLFALEIPDFETLPEFQLPAPHFVCLVVCDATATESSTVLRFADALLSRGAVFVLTWGPDCKRVHDLFDDAKVGASPPYPRFPGVMTTWHDDEPLLEALWQFLFTSSPADEFFDTCGAAVAIVVGSPEIASEVRTALSDPDAFNRAVLE